MGRPLNSKYFGAPGQSQPHLQLSSAWVPGASGAVTNAYIIKQVGTGRYLAFDGTYTGVVGLVNGPTATASGQAVIDVTVYGSAGTGATATATLKVLSATANAGGSAYVVGDVLTLTAGVGTAATLTVATVNGSGAVETVTVTSAGSYTSITGSAGLAVTGGTGTGATFNVSFGVNTVTVTAPGTDYTTATVSFSGTGGATATATVTSGSVASVTVTAPGAAYTAVPTVTIVGGSTIDYASVINAHIVKTFQDVNYRWFVTGPVAVGDAALPFA